MLIILLLIITAAVGFQPVLNVCPPNWEFPKIVLDLLDRNANWAQLCEEFYRECDAMAFTDPKSIEDDSDASEYPQERLEAVKMELCNWKKDKEEAGKDFCTRLQRTEAYCDIKSTVLIIGTVVRFSDFLPENGRFPKKLCGPNMTLLMIMASDQVVIDRNLNINGSGINLAIIAPFWEVEGNRTINLDGANGRQLGKAQSGIFPGDFGSTGIPGKAGGPGGNFLGIAEMISRGTSLTISLNGGTGGDGQDGGDGAPGRPGTTHHYPHPSNVTGVLAWFKRRVMKKGYEGSAGGNGGDGGYPGMCGVGGIAGQVQFIPEYVAQGVNIVAEIGNRGEFGVPGVAGRGGKGTRTEVCQWKVVCVCTVVDHPDGKDGLVRSLCCNPFGWEYPVPPQKPQDPQTVIDIYFRYLANCFTTFSPNFIQFKLNNVTGLSYQNTSSEQENF